MVFVEFHFRGLMMFLWFGGFMVFFLVGIGGFYISTACRVFSIASRISLAFDGYQVVPSSAISFF